MKDEKLLNVSEMTSEQVEALKKLIQKTYNKGILRGGLSLAGGFLFADLICKVVKHLADNNK